MELSETIDIAVLAGRVLFVLLFLLSAFGHFAQREMMVGYAASRGVPLAALAVPVTGLMLLFGSIGVLLGIWIDLAFLVLVVFLIPTALMMHAFWKESDPQAKQMEMTMFNKDIALAGAALMLFALTSAAGTDLGYTLTDPLFDL